MNAAELQQQLAAAQAKVMEFQQELLETQQGIVALTFESGQSIEELRAELEAAHRELSQTNSELLQFTIGLDEIVAQRTSELTNEINERRHSEERLRKAMLELARSNEELEQFAYVASHDLQEPLRMVASYTQLLAKRYEDRLDQNAQDYIHFAVEGAKRLQELILDLLTYSRITRQGEPLGPMSAGEALTEALENLGAAIMESESEITRGSLPMVTGDHGQVVQLFEHLLENAMKFRRPGIRPKVNIQAHRDPTEKHFWVFTVSDNGIGIDPVHIPRLFVIFQRLHSRQEYSGTGLGLALCKRITLRHGGRIWLESVPGDGTACRFTLPEADPGRYRQGKTAKEETKSEARP